MSYHKGETRKPCHGCGREGFWREQGTVCHECKRLMEDGRRYREEIAESEHVGVYRYSLGRPHWNEPIGVGEMRSWPLSDARKKLETAFWQLVREVVEPAPRLPNEVTKEAENLLPHHYGRELRERGRDYVLCRSDVRDALGAVFLAVQRGLEDAHKAGFHKGRSLILQLAEDEVTLSEFNDRVARVEEDE